MTFCCLDSVRARGSLLCFLLCACGSGVVDVGDLPEEGGPGSAGGPNGSGILDPNAPGSGCSMAGLGEQRLIFDSDAGGLERRIYSMRADGTGLEALTPPGELAREPALSPDGHTLAYSTSEGIKLLDLSTGLTALVAPDADQPAWSPDGQRMVYRMRYSGGNALYVRAMADGGAGDVRNDYQVYCTGECDAPEFTPDGSTVVFAENSIANQTEARSRIGKGSSVADGPGGGYDVIGNAPVAMSHPTISGDGIWVAVALECGDNSVSSLWVSPYGLTTPACEGRRTTAPDAPSARNPKWGPGVFIVYELGEPPRDLAIVAADTGETCRIDGPGDDRNPSWGTFPVAVPE